MLHQSQLILIERREAEEDVGFKRFTFLPLYIIDGLKYVVNYDCKVMFNKAITKAIVSYSFYRIKLSSADNMLILSFIFNIWASICFKVQEIVVFGPIWFYFEL